MNERNRGKAPSDDTLFGEKWLPVFKEACMDLSYLLGRGYGSKSSLQIVGNRYRLNARQQKALAGMGASEDSVILRNNKRVSASELQGKTVAIDGFNLLIILESAMSGAYIFKGMDGAYRDVTSVHGGYKRVRQTHDAILLVGNVLEKLGIKKAIWYLDAPISNSGRLKTILRETAKEYDFPWEIHLVNNPDKELIASSEIVISSDAWILEECGTWFNMMEEMIENYLDEVCLFSPE